MRCGPLSRLGPRSWGGGAAAPAARVFPLSARRRCAGEGMMADEMRPAFPPGAAIVAGGSGGLGSAISLMLGKADCPVVVGYRSRAAEAEALVAAISGAGTPASAVQLDLTDEASIGA